MKRRLPFPAAVLLGASLLSACTGTDETPPNLRLLVLHDGGKTLGYIGSNEVDKTALQGNVPNLSGVDIEYLNSGNNFALIQVGGIQNRDETLKPVADFQTPPFTPVCFKQAVMSAARDRLLVLQQCPNGPQQLALYRNTGTLVWTALLPTNLVTTPGPDTPPTRLAAGPNDTAYVARAALGGGSEVMIATPRRPGDAQADVSNPSSTVSIRDLAPYQGSIYAATDSGVRLLLPSGQTDPNTSAAQTAFGSVRYDRLWASASSTPLLAAWRDSGTGSSNFLYLWDGRRKEAVGVAPLTELRDVSFAIDGQLYALTRTTLSSYDTVLGLNNGYSWSPRTLVRGLNDARAVTWVVPRN